MDDVARSNASLRAAIQIPTSMRSWTGAGLSGQTGVGEKFDDV